jgi:hypothetical protein
MGQNTVHTVKIFTYVKLKLRQAVRMQDDIIGNMTHTRKAPGDNDVKNIATDAQSVTFTL